MSRHPAAILRFVMALVLALLACTPPASAQAATTALRSTYGQGLPHSQATPGSTPNTPLTQKRPPRRGGDTPRGAPARRATEVGILAGDTTVTYALPKVKFRVDDGYDLDQYLFGDSSPLDFSVDLKGFNVDPSRTAKVTLRVYDVDAQGAPPDCAPEVDQVSVNGTTLGVLTGANSQWSIVTFSIPGSALTSGSNNFQVAIDTGGTGCWAVEVDWAEIEIDFNIAQIEASALDDVTIKRGKTDTVIADPVWKTSFDSSGNVVSPANPNDPIADALSSPGAFNYKYKLGVWPGAQPSWQPRVEYRWEWQGAAGAPTGNAEVTGWEQQFSVRVPGRVGKYTLNVTLSIYHETQLLRTENRAHTVYVLYNTPQSSTTVTGSSISTAQPRAYWLDYATDWAGNQNTPPTILSALNTREYANPFGWSYHDRYENPIILIENGPGQNGNCYSFRDVLKILAGSLGIATTLTDYRPSEGGFMTSTRPALDANASANARNRATGNRDRWLFGNHQYAAYGGSFYDPTYGLTGPNTISGKEANVYCKLGLGATCNLLNPPPAQVQLFPTGTSVNGWSIIEYETISPFAPRRASLTAATLLSGGTFTGTPSDQGYDADSNGLFEHLQADLDVDVTQAGDFGFLASLTDSAGNVIAQGSLDPDLHLSAPATATTLSAGTQTVALYFNGFAIRSSGASGPYTVTVELLDDQGSLLDTASFATGSYSATAFQGLLADVQSLSDSGVDTDGVAGYELLRVTAQLNFLAAGELTVQGSLFAGDVWLGDVTQVLSTTAGLHSLNLDFDGETIAAAGENGPYTLYLALNDANYAVSVEHATAAYTVSQFQPPVASFAGSATDSAIDTNSNSQYDLLQVQTTLVTRTPGTYTLYGSLLDSAGDFIDVTEVTATLSLANTPISTTLAFDGRAIYQAQADGPYTITLTLADAGGALANQSHTTSAYAYTSFEHSGATLNGNFSDQAIDDDADGFYNLLRVDVGVDAADAGVYEVSGSLLDDDGNFITAAVATLTVTATGTYTAGLDFAGPAIRTYGVDGAYQLAAVELRQDGNTLDHLINAYTTQSYTAEDFQPAGMITGVFDDYGEDTDSSGRYESLILEFEVLIAIEDSYSFNARLADANGEEITWASGGAYLTPGVQQLTLAFSGPSIHGHGVDGPYLVKDLSVYSDNLADTLADVHTTAAYTTNAFEESSIVRGTVTADGQPVAGVTITVAGIGSDQTDSTGAYQIGVPSAGSYTVSINAATSLAPWRIFEEGVQVAQGTSASITVGTSDDVDVDFESASADPQCPPLGNDICVQLSTAAIQVAENGGSAIISATLTTTATTIVRVSYATSNGSATAGSDYTTRSGTLTFDPGETSQNISVPISNDSIDEPDETIILALTGSSDLIIGTPDSATITIVDNDSPPAVSFNSSSSTVGENVGAATITARLSAASGYTVTVEYATSNGTATAGSDYTATSGTLAFAPGQTTRTFTVPILEDGLGEANETISLALSSPANATLGSPNTATLTISANDVLTFNPSSYSVNESVGNATITVRLSATSAQTVTVDYATGGGTATAGSDYTATSGTVTFAPGQTTQTFTVPIIDDALGETSETISLALANPAGASLGSPSTATITIGANDTLTLSAGSYSVGENAGNAMITVRLSATAAQTVTVDYATSDGTATAGSDYTAASGTLIFAPGQTTQTFTVPIIDDLLGEANETISLALSNPTNATLGSPNTATLTINANDTLTFSAGSYSVSESVGNATITVRLSATSSQTVTVDYATSDGTATAGSDYTATSGTLTFAPGQTTQTFVVPIIDEALGEANETISLALSNPAGATLGSPNTATITINANDTLTFSASSYSVGENGGSTTITVRLSATAAQTVTVDYAASDGTATEGSDYTATSGTLIFAPGQTSRTFIVPILEDGEGEANETIALTLSNPTNASLGSPSAATITINANDVLTFNPSSYSIGENGGSATITVRLSATSAQTVTVDYTTSDGTATAGSDYTATSGTLIFAPGQTSRTFTVPILEDSLGEGNETVTLTLSNPAGATLGSPSTATITINANDALTFNPSSYSIGENGGSATITVRLSATSAQTVTVDYATGGGTATEGSDYTATSGTLTFAPGQTTRTFTVPIIDDTLGEANETISLALSNPAGASLGSPSTATLTINANDTLTFNPSSYSIGENGGSATITVRLSATSSQTVTVDYATGGGTATEGSDYTAASGTLTFAPGQTTRTFTVPILEDSLNEANETVTLTLSNPTNATLGSPSTATLTISANDTLTFNPSSYSVNESAGNATITVRLNAASGQTVTVDYATGGGTATAGSDYTATSGTLTFAPGQTSQTFTVPIINDTTDEPNETVTLTLSNPTGAALGSPSTATVTIVDND